MTREELWQLQSIQHKLGRLRQRELADSGDTFKSIIWRSQSHGEVIAYNSALVLINEFLKGEIMKTNEVKKEPSDKGVLMEKKIQSGETEQAPAAFWRISRYSQNSGRKSSRRILEGIKRSGPTDRRRS